MNIAKFIGKNVVMKNDVVLGHNVKIYGFTHIGYKTFIDNNVIIGYPIQNKILKILDYESISNVDDIIDSLSDGASIGSKIIMRSNVIIYESVLIEDNVIFGHNVLIREKTVIKHGCKIGSGTIIDGDVVIGTNTIIQSHVYIPPKVRIGSNVFIAPRTVFTNDRYPPSKRLVETVVEDNVVIGANAIITPGIVIRKGAVVAAGSIVTKSVEPYTVVAGVPAKPIMSRDEYEDKKAKYEADYIFPYR